MLGPVAFLADNSLSNLFFGDKPSEMQGRMFEGEKGVQRVMPRHIRLVYLHGAHLTRVGPILIDSLCIPHEDAAQPTGTCSRTISFAPCHPKRRVI